MPTADRPTTKQLHVNLGDGIQKLAADRVPSGNGSFALSEEIGAAIDAMLKAAVKAVIPGRQSTKQVTALQQQARQAFARALARRVKKLGEGA